MGNIEHSTLNAEHRTARLSDGSIVELQKDCGCITHEGPHWLHMDGIDRSLNRKILEDATRPEQVRAFMEAEQRRLADKLQQMKRFQIEEIL